MRDPAVIVAMLSLATALAAGGFSLYNSRSTNRKIDTETAVAETKLPAEVDSIIASTADVAVIALGKVIKTLTEQNEAMVAEAARVEKRNAEERERDRRRMTELETQLEELRGAVATAEQHLGEARAAAQRLATELSDARAEQAERRP